MSEQGGEMIEAVPNFSEGRRPDVIAALATAIQAPGVKLLHQTSDWDHNRTVLTVAGAPAAVLEGLFRAVQVAAERIDLFLQRGAHPRLGAADVVPLIPLAGSSLEACAAYARQLGQRIGDELALPVYLYEAAASRPDRRLLADVRRGEFEQLLQEIERPHRQPDFGPARVGPAGAVIVGARPFLIAFNFFLETSDVRVARAIARAIRERDGGLPAVRALGLLVDQRAQVSVNLTDFEQTPLPRLVDEVSRLARVHGTAVAQGELIGLLPQQALWQVAAHYLRLPTFSAEQVLESLLVDGR